MNKTVKDATQLAHTEIAGFIAQPISDTVITNIVEISSKYLEEKEIFKDITESFDLTDSYKSDFMKFYETALSNFLRNNSDYHTG